MANAAHSVSEQFHKLICTETGLPDDSPQCATIEFLMVRYDNLGKGFIAAQDQVVIFNVSKCSAGIGKPSSSRAAMYP